MHHVRPFFSLKKEFYALLLADPFVQMYDTCGELSTHPTPKTLFTLLYTRYCQLSWPDFLKELIFKQLQQQIPGFQKSG